MIARISRPDVADANEPGRYKFRFGWVTITSEDLATWSQYPRATFAIYQVKGETPDEYRLGTFDLRNEREAGQQPPPDLLI